MANLNRSRMPGLNRCRKDPGLMEFGSFMEFHCRPGGSQSQTFADSFAHVDQAEQSGLDAIWLAESHFAPERSVLSSPMVIATAIATRTTRVKVGTAVQVLPLGNPLRMAEEAASLDHISEGRFEFGVGRSGLPGAYEGYNISYGESRERFFEALDIIRMAWTEERFSYHGKFYSYDEVCLVPKPYQSPHPPLRMAATTSESFPAVGRMGLPLFIGLRVASLAQVEEQVEAYRRAWTESGHSGPIDVSLRVPVYVANSAREAVDEAEESFMSQFRRLGSRIASIGEQAGTPEQRETSRRNQHLASVPWDDVRRDKVVVGTPDMVVERLREMKDRLQLSGVVAEFNAGGSIPPERWLWMKTEMRPAFYSLGSGAWRDYVTLLHLPFTVWHLSYVVLGATVAPVLQLDRLAWTCLAFFLGVGVAAHALDELHDRPLRSGIRNGALLGMAGTSLAAALLIGVYASLIIGMWMVPFVVFGAVIVLAYNLEWSGGRFHSGLWFGLAWGAFPALAGYWANAERLDLEAFLIAGACFVLSLAQRELSRRVKSVRRNTRSVSGRIDFIDGRTEQISAAYLISTPEAALKLTAAAMALFAAGALVSRV